MKGAAPKRMWFFEKMAFVDVSSDRPKSLHFGPKSAKLGSFGARWPEQALLFNQNPNVGPLLFTDPTVVLLLLLTIRTVFSAA